MMTLEQFGNQRLAAEGVDTTNPNVQAKLKSSIDAVRATAPGLSDDDIIAQHGDEISAKVTELVSAGRQAKMAAAAAPAQAAAPASRGPAPVAPPAQSFADQTAAVQQEFSPEAEAAVRAKAKDANFASDIGRRLNVGFRAGAGAQGQAFLDQQYQESQNRNNQGIVDWQAKKKAALADIQERIQAGTADREVVKGELTKLGLEQALEERRDKQALARAEADPQSITSEGMRKLAVEYATTSAPDLVPQLQKMSAAQIKQYMPFIEKKYTKMLDDQQKELDRAEKGKERDFKASESAADRASREKAAATTAAGRVRAAGISAAAKAASAGQPKPLKPSDALALEKEMSVANESLAGAQDTIANFDRLEALIKGGLSTGPIVGSGPATAVSKYFSKDRQTADSITKNIVSSAAKTFGGNPTEGERKYIEEANSVMQLDDPLPRLAELRSKFEALAALRQARVAKLKGMAGEAPDQTGITPESFNAKWAKLSSGQSLVGPDGQTYTKK